MEEFDFPLTRFGDLIRAATCARDKALWCCLGGCGCRMSEAINLRWHHIDIAQRRVYLEDPELRRFGAQMTLDEKIRFKGRTTSKTYLFEPIKSEFFNWLESYIRFEYIPTREHDFVFQIMAEGYSGKPLKDASDLARIKSFKRSVKRAGILGPHANPDHIWTPHSLRHMYGVYMLNHIPVPRGYGLRDSEVQMLMGHKNIISTRIYARRSRILLEAKLEAADRMIYDDGFDINNFPEVIANRLQAEANKYRLLAKA